MASLTWYSFIFLPLLRPVSSQRHSKIEIKLINDTTIASMCSSEKKKVPHLQFSSVQFSRSVVSNSLWLHELQHTRPPCPSPTHGVHSNSCPSSWWCHPTISSSVISFSSRLQSFPASGSFQMSQLFTSGGQSIRSFSFNISPSNEHLGLIFFRIEWLDLLAVQGTLKSLLQHHSSKASIPPHSTFFTVQLSHPYMTTGKTIALSRRTLVGKVMSLFWICYLSWS